MLKREKKRERAKKKELSVLYFCVHVCVCSACVCLFVFVFAVSCCFKRHSERLGRGEREYMCNWSSFWVTLDSC